MSLNLNNNNLDNDTIEMLKSFVSESFDSLDSSEHLIEEIREGRNNEHINAVFRVFHTLKGLSGFFGMSILNKVTHEAETLLDLIRKNPGRINDDIISAIYSTYDFLRELLNRVSIDYSDASAEEEYQDMILIIRDLINSIQNPVKENSFFFEENDEAGEFLTEDNLSVTNTLNTNNIQNNPSNQESNEQDNEFLSQYIEGSFELCESISDNLIILEKEPHNVEIISQAFRAVHSLKGNSGFMGFGEIEEIAMDMESILDSVRTNDLELNEMIISILLANLEMINSRISNLGLATNGSPANKIIISNENDNLPVEFNLDSDDSNDEPLRITEPTKIAPVKINETTKIQSEHTDSETKKTVVNQKKDMRVDTAKIDRLFDLVGELITIESMVTGNPDIKGLNLPNFARSANMLNKITRELQEVTLSVRMTPLDGLFNKMKRLVRDVSIKMNKKVDLVISGQETEMDKNIIDEIADPLVHLIRNSIDHGIEMPNERIEKGKSDVGKVYLSAKYEGNEILIIIKDDGKGLDTTKILNKAAERGLINSVNDKLSDKEIFKLIFEPGFSTADKVTDISGRGVGMDVVKKNIEKLRGSIDIESVWGTGSSIILRIPLTLAIIESMIFRIGDSRFAMPILSVIESLKITSDKISKTMDDLEFIKVRNELIPVVRLYEIFHKTPNSYELEDGLLVIVESKERKVCLFVDEIIGQQQAVVKSLTDYIGKVPGITGCMILGDGGIGLILDIEGIVDISEKPDYKFIFKDSRRIIA
jgi:two-component system chemotaxis sensor kinase CheA